MRVGIKRQNIVWLVTMACVALLLAGMSLKVASDQRESLAFSPYADLYALQQTTRHDVGFLEDGVYAGFGGNGQGIDITLQVGDMTFYCSDASYEIAGLNGILIGGKVFCPAADADNAAEALTGAITRINAQGFWSVEDDFLTSARRTPAWGTTITQAFGYLASPDLPRQSVNRVPIRNWQGQGGQKIGLNAVRYRKYADNRMFYEISFSYPTDCITQLGVYSIATPDDPQSWNNPRLAPLRAYFNNRPFNEIPTPERTLLASGYAEEVCKTD